MSSRKRIRKKSAQPSRVRRRQSTWQKLKKNWPMILLSSLMAFSLMARFLRPSRRTATPRAATPAAMVTPAGNATALDVSGNLTVAAGQQYEYHLSVPESWQGKYESQTEANQVTFSYDLSPSQVVPLFSLAAYPEAQWTQLQSTTDNQDELLLTKDGVAFTDRILLKGAVTGNEDPTIQDLRQEIPRIVHSLTVTPTS